jgi:Spy/CpxP family protein refolding chaperone
MIQRKLLVILALGALCALPTGAFAQEDKDEKPVKLETPAAGEGAPAPRRQLSPEERLKQLQTTLKLTDEQVGKIKPLMEEQRKQQAELRNLPREERAAKVKEFRESFAAKYKAVLTPEQFEKWQKRQQGAPGGNRVRRAANANDNDNDNGNGAPPPPPKN